MLILLLDFAHGNWTCCPDDEEDIAASPKPHLAIALSCSSQSKSLIPSRPKCKCSIPSPPTCAFFGGTIPDWTSSICLQWIPPKTLNPKTPGSPKTPTVPEKLVFLASFRQKSENFKNKKFRKKSFGSFSVAKTGEEKKIKKNSQIRIFGFHYVAKQIKKWLKKDLDFLFLVYSQIWLNLPRNDCNFFNIFQAVFFCGES